MKNIITKDRALLFSASVLIIYLIICEIQLFLGLQPNDSLTVAMFATFGVAEGGYCAYLKKKKENMEQVVRNGDITGYDDAEIVDVAEEQEKEIKAHG